MLSMVIMSNESQNTLHQATLSKYNAAHARMSTTVQSQRLEGKPNNVLDADHIPIF